MSGTTSAGDGELEELATAIEDDVEPVREWTPAIAAPTGAAYGDEDLAAWMGSVRSDAETAVRDLARYARNIAERVRETDIDFGATDVGVGSGFQPGAGPGWSPGLGPAPGPAGPGGYSPNFGLGPGFGPGLTPSFDPSRLDGSDGD